ncbi:MAG: PAS domain-containing protein [Acidobacteriota bacterium]|nr:PAS domain-containing protein [Acidobacteriota bacterium]
MHRGGEMVDRWQGYRETLDSLLEGFQIISHDWTYLYLNPAAAAQGRHAPDELIGRRLMDMYPGIQSTPLFATLERCMRERTVASFENLFTFPDGSSRWFEIRVEPVPEGLCIHSVDIHDRRQAEARLREQESVATLGRMAGVVAHEVKNPLAGLAGALQVLKGRRPDGDPELALFDQMLQSIGSLDRLLQDLLIFARPMRIQSMPVAVGDAVQDALRQLEHDRKLQAHTVKLSADEPSPIVRGDRELLTGVFRNLLLNAAEAMREAGTITVQMSRENGSCLVTLSDTGPGVPEELATQIFEPFVTGRRGGTGLGLAISRRILRLHGGELALRPRQAAGSSGATFVATIPLHPER